MCSGISGTKMLIYPYIVTLYEPFSELTTGNTTSIIWRHWRECEFWVKPYHKRHMQFRLLYDDVIKWRHLPRYWSFVRGIHRSPVNSPDKGQWRGALMFSFFCAWTNSWVKKRDASDFRRHRAHYDVTVMHSVHTTFTCWYWSLVNIACSHLGFCIPVFFSFHFLVYKPCCWNITIRPFIVLGIAYYIASYLTYGIKLSVWLFILHMSEFVNRCDKQCMYLINKHNTHRVYYIVTA